MDELRQVAINAAIASLRDASATTVWLERMFSLGAALGIPRLSEYVLGELAYYALDGPSSWLSNFAGSLAQLVGGPAAQPAAIFSGLSSTFEPEDCAAIR
jgi:hypothetical protein